MEEPMDLDLTLKVGPEDTDDGFTWEISDQQERV